MVSLFVDIASTFFNSSFNSFSTRTFVVLFEVTFLFIFFSLSLKSVVFTKLAIPFLLVKLVCANLAAKFFTVNLLTSAVAIF